jgi:hypothetical protein
VYRECTKVFSVQVFFAPNLVDRAWKVVLQKEQRSRRVEAGVPDVTLGAAGRNAPARYEGEDQREGAIPTTTGLGVGEEVPFADIQMLEANMEPENAPQQYTDLDFVDDEENVFVGGMEEDEAEEYEDAEEEYEDADDEYEEYEDNAHEEAAN